MRHREKKNSCKRAQVNLIKTDLESYELNISNEVNKEMKDTDHRNIIKPEIQEKISGRVQKYQVKR